MSEPIQYPAPYGKPVQHKRRRKLANGYTYDSSGCIISPRGQLVFRRRDHKGRSVLIEGDNLQLWAALQGCRRLAAQLKAAKRRRA